MSTATPSLQGGSADICDILESAATEAASLSDKETIQLASCPRAHACLQGVVERQFHPIHLRDFYSVINYLLLRLSLLLRERDSDFANDEGKGGVGGGISAPEVAKLKRQVDELQRKNKERKAKYEELYRINQQWLADYNDLKKQLKVPSHHENPASQLPCQQCIAMEREVEEKKALVQDLQNQLEKTMAKSRDARRDLEEKNTVIQDLINECSALRLQFQEIGGLSAAMRQRDDREELIKEVKKLRDRNTELEKDRAKVQTQLNQFRLSVRQLLFNSSHTNHTSNHTQYQPSSSRLATHSQAPPTNSYRLSDGGGGGGGDSYDIRVPPGMAAEGYVYPKQFAPKPTPRHYITYNSASNGYKTPPTPPGLLSRGKFQQDYDCSPPMRRYEPHPYKPDTIVEQVVGGGGASKLSPPQRAMTSSQFLDPSMYQQELLSPVNAPRPMSAPGSLLVSPFSSDVHMLASPQSHSSLMHQQNTSHSACSSPGSANNESTLLHTPTSSNHAHHTPTLETKTNRPRPVSLKLQEDGYHSNSATSSPHYTDCSSVFSENETIHCHHCNMAFPRHPDSCDAWLDHITNCALSGQ